MNRADLQDLVSILIPCFNAERWIAQAVESALAQTYRPIEVVVVDDGSTDGSLEIIRRFGDSIRWETGPNRGGNAARNRLLELSRGCWVQYLDADDYLLPGKVAGQAAALAACPDLDAVFGPVTLEHWSEDGARLEPLPIPHPADHWVLLALWRLPQTGAFVWRKQALVDIGGWTQDQPCCQEHELYLRALIAGKRLAYSSATGAVYRQWSDQTVCRRNLSEVHRQRLRIEDRLEKHLRAHGLLTPERGRAINQARFEVARSAWRYDCAFAGEIMRQVHRSDPSFVPNGAAAPPRYRALYRLLGFTMSERLAEWRRTLAGTISSVGSKRRA